MESKNIIILSFHCNRDKAYSPTTTIVIPRLIPTALSIFYTICEPGRLISLILISIPPSIWKL